LPKIAGVNHLDAVRGLQKAGFRIARQGKHIVMTDGIRILTIPRHILTIPPQPATRTRSAVIVRDAGLTPAQVRDFL
jgi:hypothetical protein